MSNNKPAFPASVLRVLLVILIIVLGFFILRPVLGLLLGTLFLAFILNPLVELIQSKGASRQAAALTSYLLLVMVLLKSGLNAYGCRSTSISGKPCRLDCSVCRRSLNR